MRKAAPSFLVSAILGLIAMWALLLQGTLATANAEPFDPAQGIHCGQDQSGSPATPDKSSHQHQCCTASHISKAVLPTPQASSFRFELTPASAIVWRISTFLEKTGPPERDHNPRGPPAL